MYGRTSWVRRTECSLALVCPKDRFLSGIEQGTAVRIDRFCGSLRLRCLSSVSVSAHTYIYPLSSDTSGKLLLLRGSSGRLKLRLTAAMMGLRLLVVLLPALLFGVVKGENVLHI